MTAWKTEFRDRAAEVDGYFDLLKALDCHDAVPPTPAPAPSPSPASAEQVKTLKAAAFLLLYNLVESTMRNGVEAIVGELRQQQVSFDAVRAEMRVFALSNLRRRAPKDVERLISRVESDLLTCAFDRDELFEGNVDARLIRDTAKELGFSQRNRHKGDDLLTVKTTRNDLGHGYKSFGEVGREYSVPELLRMKDNVVSYLGDVVANIDEFITKQQYLSDQASAEPSDGVLPEVGPTGPLADQGA